MAETFQAWTEALQAEVPLEALVDVAKRRLAEGTERDDLVAELERFRLVLQQDDRDTDEDLVLDLLDFITGFSSPHQRI